MSPVGRPPTQRPSDEASDLPPHDIAGKWILTKEALDKLLHRFSPDHEEAGRQYELMRNRLVRFFERRPCPLPEDLTDETINRVARRIDEGEIIFNLPAYFLSVARLVFMESTRHPDRTSVPLDEIPNLSAEQPIEDDQKEARLRCLDGCLDQLSPEGRKLILEYYVDVKRAKISHRRQLAEESTMNALRIRTCRIRKGLEKCVRDCVKPKA